MGLVEERPAEVLWLLGGEEVPGEGGGEDDKVEGREGGLYAVRGVDLDSKRSVRDKARPL